MNRIKLFLFVSLISLCMVFGYLSYRFYGEKATLVAEVDRLVDVNQTLVNDAENASRACEIIDQINRENSEAQQSLDKDRDAVLDQIDKLSGVKTNSPSVPTQEIKETRIEKTEEIDLDGLLPSELSSLLEQTYRDSIQR